jgi:hypothetical protein
LKYSSVIITDDNSDTEMENLADQNGYGYNQFLGFYSNLDSKFTPQQNPKGYEEWVCTRVLPNHSIDCVAPIVESILAYEFGNGFMVFGERDSIYD